MLMNGSLKAQTAYIASLETIDPAKLKEDHLRAKDDAKPDRKKGKKPPGPFETPAKLQVKGALDKLLELHAKLNGDITPAKREIAIGKLESHDLNQLWKLMRHVFLPIMGLSSMMFIFEQMAQNLEWTEQGATEEKEEKRHNDLESFHTMLKQLHEPFASMMPTLDGAFQHVLLTLELVKPGKKKQPDEESKGDESAQPGASGFAEVYKMKVDKFYSSKQKTLRDWCNENGVELPSDFFESSFFPLFSPPSSLTTNSNPSQCQSQTGSAKH